MAGESIRDRIRELSLDPREILGLVVIGALLAVGVGFWYVRSLPKPVSIEAPSGSLGSGPQPGPSVTPTTPPALLLVHVAGWVVRPGVYELRQGDRVIDAIERAGGARRGADLRSINLAAVLVDAQQIVVMKAGSGTSATSTGPVATGAGGSSGSTPGQELIDLNTATPEQLETLPGIGEVLAQRIIDYREEHGPFSSIDELLDVSGIGDARLEDLRSEVTV
jgi:competence protein ComEA